MPSGRSSREFLCPSQLLQVPASFGSGSPLHLQAASHLEVSLPNLCFHYLISLFESETHLSLLKMLVITVWEHLDNLESSSHLEVLHLITSAKYLWPCKATFLQVSGIRTQIPLEGHYPTYHTLQDWLLLFFPSSPSCPFPSGSFHSNQAGFLTMFPHIHPGL